MLQEPHELIDALPYIDTAIDSDSTLHEQVRRLVRDELLAPESEQQEHQLVERLVVSPSRRPFLTKALRLALDSLEADHSENVQSANIAEIRADTPPSTKDPQNLQNDQLETWTKCLNQIKIKLEYKQRQMTNLDLLKTYGKPAWELRLEETDKMTTILNQQIEELNDKIKEVNSRRKTSQEHIARHLDVLQSQWDNLTIGNQMIAEEIARLNNQRTEAQK